MLKNYFIITLRNLIKNRLFTIINIASLAIGMASVILVLLYVNYELEYNKSFKNHANIYRLIRDYSIGGEQSTNPSTSYGLAPACMERISGVKVATRRFNRNIVVSLEDKVFNEYVSFTDSLYFDIFDYEFVQGNPKAALDNPNEIILNETTAKKYFGNDNPIGKVLTFDDQEDFTITAVIKDPPANSDFRNPIFAPIAYFKKRGIPSHDWEDNFFNTFILIEHNVDINQVEEQLTQLYKEKMDDGRDVSMHIEDLTGMHFNDGKGNEDKTSIYLFMVIGFFILVIACINYMNLSTSRYIKRTKEVGLRKVLGSNKKQLIFQFYGESFLVSLFAAFFGIILVETALPFFNHITTSEIDIYYLSLKFIILIGSVVLISGLLAGSYPALFLSSFKTMSILKDNIVSNKGSHYFRKILVIIQFTVTTILLIATGTVYFQFKYMLNEDVGIGVEDVLYLNLNQQIGKNYDAFKNSMLASPDITQVSRVSFLPTYAMGLVNNIGWNGASEDDRTAFAFNSVDLDFFNTVELKLLEGRFLSKDFASDSLAVVINRKAKELISDGSALGMEFDLDDPLTVVGVVENFHSLPLTYAMEPFMFFMWEDYYSYMLVKIDGNKRRASKYIEEQWKEFSPSFPFRYEYLEDFNKRLYGDTEREAKAFGFFVIVAILISCAGLYGLSAFTAEQKTKEIGIRKALGATSRNILVLLSSSFSRWIAVSYVIGVPIAFFVMRQWQKSFAYSEDFNLSIYILTAIAILIITSITISYQTLRTAHANPVESLRYE